MSLKFKRNYPTVLLLVFVLAFLTLAMGDQRIIAYSTKAAGSHERQAASSRFDITNAVDVFDDSVVHSIQVIMPEQDYEEMLSTYKNTGLKEYFHADIIIDGVRVNNVGIRLKGNASLQTALGGRAGGNRPAGGNRQPMNADGERPQPPGGNQRPPMPGNGPGPGAPENAPANAQAAEPPADQAKVQVPGPAADPARQGPPDGGPADFGQSDGGEKKIPFMVKFDEYVDGQTYQGHTAISIRNYGISADAAMIQEPVTNDTARLVGLPASQTAYTGFQINDTEAALYVVAELVNQEYLVKYFENSDGILYKAEVGSTLKYQGEDPSSYARSFTQQTRVNDADLAPLIAFMRFIDQADEATFEADLPKWLDVDSFATYLAINVLLVNTDSILGMNNNYYLYYDESAKQFSLLMWDANESLGKLGGSANYSFDFANTDSNRGGGPGRNGGPGGGQNALVKRFMANATFKALYEKKVRVIYQQAFLNGAITDDIERYSKLIHSINDQHNLVDINRYDQAIQKALNFIQQRMEYLSTTQLLAQ